MNPIVIIPARMASTRLPGKPLADIHGKPMIVRMLELGQAADIGPVAVACGDADKCVIPRLSGATPSKNCTKTLCAPRENVT